MNFKDFWNDKACKLRDKGYDVAAGHYIWDMALKEGRDPHPQLKEFYAEPIISNRSENIFTTKSKCLNCGEIGIEGRANYCPNCGIRF